MARTARLSSSQGSNRNGVPLKRIEPHRRPESPTDAFPSAQSGKIARNNFRKAEWPASQGSSFPDAPSPFDHLRAPLTPTRLYDNRLAHDRHHPPTAFTLPSSRHPASCTIPFRHSRSIRQDEKPAARRTTATPHGRQLQHRTAGNCNIGFPFGKRTAALLPAAGRGPAPP